MAPTFSNLIKSNKDSSYSKQEERYIGHSTFSDITQMSIYRTLVLGRLKKKKEKDEGRLEISNPKARSRHIANRESAIVSCEFQPLFLYYRKWWFSADGESTNIILDRTDRASWHQRVCSQHETRRKTHPLFNLTKHVVRTESRGCAHNPLWLKVSSIMMATCTRNGREAVCTLLAANDLFIFRV